MNKTICVTLRGLLVIALVTSAACSTPRTAEPGQGQQTVSVSDALPESGNWVDRGWQAYRQLSDQLKQADEAQIRSELAAEGMTEATEPPRADRFGFDPDQPANFYATAEGERILDIILSFQTPSGGWSKRTDMSQRPRRAGEAFGTEDNYIPTFDNGATTTQLWVLTRAYQATGEARYKDAVLRALELILAAQYPNGGWPQTFPLRGGYHDDITFNDGVMGNLIRVVHAASEGQHGLDFVPENLRRQAETSYDRAIEAVLATQVIVDGQRTIWGAQHDPHSMLPTSARAYEPEALATMESAELVLALMLMDELKPEVTAAIKDAVSWFEENRIEGWEWVDPTGDESPLQPRKGAGPLWPRFAEIGTNRAIFGDRDGGVYYDVDEISRERQLDYAWYTDAPRLVLSLYPEWLAKQSGGK